MKPGVYRGLSYAEYDAIPAIRSSKLTSFREATPAHWKAKAEDLDRACFASGRELHVAVLEPERFRERVKEMPLRPTAQDLGFADFRTAAARAARDAAYAEIEAEVEGGEFILDTAQFSAVEQMADSVRRHCPFLRNLDCELTVVWEDEETGLLCKCRIDAWDSEELRMWELKKTRVIATPDRFAREIRKYHYAHQLAWYTKGAQAQLGGVASENPCGIIVVEDFKPHLVAAHPVNSLTMMTAKIEIDQALRDYADCVKYNDWPGHEGGDHWYLPGHSESDLGITFAAGE